MSGSRRPSVSIYDYPEHLNPFNDGINDPQPDQYREGKAKESKRKFWTFGRSRKKRSNSFSIKSTWNGLFGKKKEDRSEISQKRSTIITVPSTYEVDPYIIPAPLPRVTKDQQEFDEALATLARRRKYTLDNSSSRYSSSVTVNGDPARLFEGSPRSTTTSIMGDLTPKPPVRRFGQISPKPMDKIPPLDFEYKNPMENESPSAQEKPYEKTPIPPLRRFGNRASQRTNTSTLDSMEEISPSVDVTMYDENENVPSDYVFKRCSQDPIRKSNLSINSCVSVASTMSSSGRKKRRAPQPPRRLDNVETNKLREGLNIELQRVETMDARVPENIVEMTKDSPTLNQQIIEKKQELEAPIADLAQQYPKIESVVKEQAESSNIEPKRKEYDFLAETIKKHEDDLQVEYCKISPKDVEIITPADQVNLPVEKDDVCFCREDSSATLPRSDSFSVKDEIEKIEKQIRALETRNASTNSSDEKNITDLQENTRLSIHENRRHFFQNIAGNEDDKNTIKIEFKEFPKEQKNIDVVRLDVSPVPTAVISEPIKVIELHISEPIKQKPEVHEDANPIPKPRRHSALSLNDSGNDISPIQARKSFESNRGKSF